MKKINIVNALIVSLIWVFSGLAMETDSNQKQIDLINNAAKELLQMRNTFKEFRKDLYNHQQNSNSKSTVYEVLKGYQEFVNKWEKKNSIFLLTECLTCEATIGNVTIDIPCSLSRFKNVSREKYEEIVSSKLSKRLAEHKEVNYVDFGSGPLFQTLVILAKALQKQNTGIVNVHLIDLDYKSYVRAHTVTNKGLDSIIGTFDLQPHIPELIKAIKNELPKNKEIEKKIISDCGALECKIKQFQSFLNQHYPEANVHLFLHESYDNYFKNLKKYNLTDADIISAADIDDSVGNELGGSDCYKKICAQTLAKKPDSENIWLARNNEDKPQIKTIKLKNDNLIIEDENI